MYQIKLNKTDKSISLKKVEKNIKLVQNVYRISLRQTGRHGPAASNIIKSVFTRTGDIVAESGDYSANQVSYDDTVISTVSGGTVTGDDVQEILDNFVTVFAPYVTTLFARVPPSGGNAGQVLAKETNASYDYVWVDQSGGGGAVDSVNSQTGVVVLDTDDIADTAANRYTNDTDITRLANTSGTNTGDQVADGVTITGDGTVGDPFVAVTRSSAYLTYMLSGSNSDISTYEQAVSLPSFTTGSLATSSQSVSTTPTLLSSFATNTGFPNITVIPSGVFNFHFETQKTAGSNNYYAYAELYKRNLAGTETLLVTSDNSSNISANTVQSITLTAFTASNISLLPSDRLVLKVYAVMLSATATITLRYDDNTDSRFELPSSLVDATNFVPYLGATKDLDLGTYNILTSGTVDGRDISSDGTKLDGIEAGAEVNNISDANATDLTDGGVTTLHSHTVTKSDVGLGNVDNTSDATKNTAVATLTNKRITARTFTTASTATLTPEKDTYDLFHITALAGALNVANHSTTTPADGDQIRIRLLDDGTARAITWDTNYVGKGGIPLPSTTVLGKNLELGFEWNSNLGKYNLLALAQEA